MNCGRARESRSKGIEMPWSVKQHNLFESAAHNPAVAQRVGIPVAKAQKMASEGIKRGPLMAQAMKRK